jgi:ammonium transporter, Amt family
VTTISAAAASLTWVIMDYIQHKKFSGIGFCSGVISGLVCITPAAGFVGKLMTIE